MASTGIGKFLAGTDKILVCIHATFRFAAELENIFHRLFGAAQIDLTIEDRFGHPVKPREWFMVPLQVIDEAVECIRNGSITDAVYDLKPARLTNVV